jgi:hypothetical protein
VSESKERVSLDLDTELQRGFVRGSRDSQSVPSDRMAHADDLSTTPFLPFLLPLVLQILGKLSRMDMVGTGWKTVLEEDNHVPGLARWDGFHGRRIRGHSSCGCFTRWNVAITRSRTERSRETNHDISASPLFLPPVKVFHSYSHFHRLLSFPAERSRGTKRLTTSCQSKTNPTRPSLRR